MTTQKWVKKQISFARDNINDIEDLKNHLQSILTRLELSPLEKTYQDGLDDGQTKQAILELRGRDKFLEETVRPQVKELEKIKKKYDELIMMIPDKCSGETKHERLVRYIKCYKEIVFNSKNLSRMQLCNRADGVDGHYCIGRPIGDSIYFEYYNDGKWCSAGEVFVGRDRAEKMLFALQAPGGEQI